MINLQKIRSGLIGAGALLLCSTSLAYAQSASRDVAIDGYHQPLVDSRGNCVHTKWQKGGEICDNNVSEQIVVQETRTIVSPARQLTHEQRTVLFDFDKDTLDETAKRNLNSLSDVLHASTDVRSAHIVGYADPIGSADYNQALSQRRAESVKNYLAERGYINTRVADVRALGSSNQFASCDEVHGRNEKISCLRPNRRVEVELEFIE